MMIFAELFVALCLGLLIWLSYSSFSEKKYFTACVLSGFTVDSLFSLARLVFMS